MGRRRLELPSDRHREAGSPRTVASRFPTRPPHYLFLLLRYPPFVRPAPEASGRLIGTPFVPTRPERRGAQVGSKAPPLGGGSAATAQLALASEHGEHPPFDATEHRGARLRSHRPASREVADESGQRR